MTVRFPQLVTSRDGQRALLLEEFAPDVDAPVRFDGFPADSIVRLRPRGDRFAVYFKVSGSFRSMWDATGQTLKWNEKFATALPALSLIALGRFLDANPIPEDPIDGEYALTVPVFSDLFGIFKQAPATDDELRAYVHGKIFWAWKFNAEPTEFEPWECQRLRVARADLDGAAFPHTGRLWTRTTGGYTALPALARMGPPKSRAESVGEGSYDVALSFAGEERPYVSQVAAALKDGGASVFYDEFADLWGKDLTRELERVYRSSSRFVVIFVSRAYVEKAWPNLERQHALAGRIERMDDSVLPARFDAIELPGLPSTVGYLDIGARSPRELADLVLTKLTRTA